MRVTVPGGSGFIGVRLAERLAMRGDTAVIVSRDPDAARRRFEAMPWAGEALRRQGLTFASSQALPQALAGADAVVNLAGEGIADKPWTSAQRKRIVDSRVASATSLVKALASLETPPRILVQGSAIGYYGDTGDNAVDETAPMGKGFLAETAAAWEAASAGAEALGVRRVLLRTGVVLDLGGGTLAKMLPAYKSFLGGPLGSGAQWMSWIHRDDEVGAILHCLDTPTLAGPVNACAPEPVTNLAFCQTLARTLHRPCGLNVPASMLKLLFGDMARELLLASQRVRPAALLASGHRFLHGELAPALAAIFAT